MVKADRLGFRQTFRQAIFTSKDMGPCLPGFLNQVRVKKLPSSSFLHLDLLHSRSNQLGTFEPSFL